jgi:hypothetical protein
VNAVKQQKTIYILPFFVHFFKVLCVVFCEVLALSAELIPSRVEQLKYYTKEI